MRRFALALALAAPLFASPASACGGLFCSRIPVDQSGEKILFACDGQTVTAHVQIQYKGEASKFGWILPVPTPPKLGVGTDALFTALRSATQPQFQITITDDGPCEQPRRRDHMRMEGAGSDKDVKKEKSPGVRVISQEQVGPYDTAVLQANDTGVLKDWLRKNDYVIPAKVDPLLGPYVAGKYSFVALKLTKNKAAGDIQPIVMTYKATKPGIPMRLTGVAATPDMDVFVWVLGAKRAVPENYRHTRINEARINWLNGGYNYKDVVTHAVDEAGGQAFVTDYAGPADVIGADKLSRAHFRLDSLARLTEPVAFANAVVDAGFFGERYSSLNADALVGFLKRYIRKPHSLASTSDVEFYRYIDQHKEALDEAGIRVDTRRAIAELEAKVVKPSEEAGHLFEKFHYLTALYTTMSPAEMTQDPTFRFNTRLREVAAVRHATGVRHCQRNVPYWQSPIEVTLSNGQRFTTHAGGRYDDDGALPTLPYAATIEQLGPDGDARIIQDNAAEIAADLAPRQTPAPRPVGNWAAGGGVLGGLALLGLRRWRRRK